MLLEREIFQKIGIKKIKTHFMFHNVFSEWCHLWDNVEKYGTAKQATDNKTIRRMLFTAG
jgi:hypothetical protein